MKIIRVFLSSFVIVLAGYMLLSQDFSLMPVLMLLFGSFVLVVGVSAIKKRKQSVIGYLLLIVSLLLFWVSYRGFLL